MMARIVFFSAILACCIGCACSVQAQDFHRVQPILLEAESACCSSPATTASQLVCLPCGDSTYLPPADRDPLRVVPVASQLKPLPAVPAWRGYETACDFAAGCAPRIHTAAPATTVLRPTVCAPAGVGAPMVVPDGYVVGKGLIGQPKLYKPGQPVRNFLRYITL